jgi:hypothetical protein
MAGTIKYDFLFPRLPIDTGTGLPEGIFSDQKSQIGVNFAWHCNGRCYYIFMNIRSILWPFDILYGHLVYFVVNWYISTRVGILYQEKSGSPARE